MHLDAPAAPPPPFPLPADVQQFIHSHHILAHPPPPHSPPVTHYLPHPHLENDHQQHQQHLLHHHHHQHQHQIQPIQPFQHHLHKPVPHLQQFRHEADCHDQQQHALHPLGLPSESAHSPLPLLSIPASNPGNSSPTADGLAISVKEPLEDDDTGADDTERGMGINRWPRQETLALLNIRSDMDGKFRDSSHKGPLWEEVSRSLSEIGYNRSAKKCREKFENVYKYYKKTKEGRAGRQDGKTYRFFNQLEALCGGSNHMMNCASDGNEGGNLLVDAQDTGGCFSSTVGAAAAVQDNRPALPQGSAEIHSDLVFSSDCSEEDQDEPQEKEHGGSSRKRKRKSWCSKMACFLEATVKRAMDQQEAMHQKLLETLDRREQERTAREEAWRRQETARINREHERRAQENAFAAARDTALFAFMQKVTGHAFPLSQVAPPSPLTIPDVHEQDKDSFDLSSKRWPKAEIQNLIKLRTGMESRFQGAGPKGLLWEEISTGMACLGYDRSAKRCKEKWENINKYFKKAKDSNRKRTENSKTCPYFSQLDSLYQNGFLGTPNGTCDKLDVCRTKQSNYEFREDERKEDLELIPHNENGSAGTLTNNVVGQQTHTMQENGNGGNGMSGIDKLKESCVENTTLHSSLPVSFSELQAAKELSEMQQHQQPNSSEDYERL